MKQPAVVQYALRERCVELREMPVPSVIPGHVLLKVGAVGICGTDVHQYLNEHSWPVDIPIVMGHEFGGEIVDVGSGVTEFAPGDRVVSETAAYICGECPYCKTGKYYLCPKRKGFGQLQNGGMTQYVLAPVRCLHRIPKKLPLSVAALCEPCCVAYHTVAVHAKILPGMSVAILGCGFTGLLCTIFAKMRGAYPIILSGLSKDTQRLNLGRQLGATHTVAVDRNDIRPFVSRMGDGNGVDVVVDVSGRNQSLKDAIDIIRPGGQIVRVSWGPGAYNFSLDPLVHKEVRLQGVFSHNWQIWERVLQLIQNNVIDFSPFPIARFPIEQWQTGFEGMRNAEFVRAVLEPNGPME